MTYPLSLPLVGDLVVGFVLINKNYTFVPGYPIIYLLIITEGMMEVITVLPFARLRVRLINSLTDRLQFIGEEMDESQCESKDGIH